jgi:hypothetical protein
MHRTSGMVRAQAAANAAYFEWGTWVGAAHVVARLLLFLETSNRDAVRCGGDA